MAEVDFTEVARSIIATPAAGVAAVYVETDAQLRMKLPSGAFRAVSELSNSSSTVQTVSNTNTRTYLTGSQIALPVAGALQIGSVFQWNFDLTKTAAGTQSSTFDLAFGTTGGTTDTARVSFVTPQGGTAAADTGQVQIIAVVRGPISTSGVVSGNFALWDNQTTGGGLLASGHYANLQTVQSSTFDVTLPTSVGVCVTSGTLVVLSAQQVFAQAWNI